MFNVSQLLSLGAIKRLPFNGLLLLSGYNIVVHVILLAAWGPATGSHPAPDTPRRLRIKIDIFSPYFLSYILS